MPWAGGGQKCVCVEQNASGNERYAAAQLRKILHKGGISTDTLATKKGTIYVGNTPYLRKHFASYIDCLHDDGVRMMFEQASGADNITSWMDIRCYMIAKLLWNPDANMDSIMADFYQGYYGDAGKYVKSIIDTMTAGQKAWIFTDEIIVR